MVDCGRRDGIADFGKALVARLQIGQAAVAQLGEESHQLRDHVLAGQSAPQSHCPHLLMGLAAGMQQLVVGRLVDLRPGVGVDIVEFGGFGFVGQIAVRSLSPPARFVQDQARGIQLAGKDGHGAKHPDEHRPFQFVEELPLHHAGPVSVAQDALPHLILDPARQACGFHGEVHALHGQAAHCQHAHLVTEIEPHRRRRLAPRADHVETGVLRQLDLADGHLAAVGVGQSHGIQPLEEGGLQVHGGAVESESLVANGELTHPESRGPLVGSGVAARHVDLGAVQVGIVR